MLAPYLNAGGQLRVCAFVMAKIIDTGIREQDLAYILEDGRRAGAPGVIGLACSLTAQYFAAKAAAGFEQG